MIRGPRNVGDSLEFTVISHDYHEECTFKFAELDPLYYPILVKFNVEAIRHCVLQTETLCEMAVASCPDTLRFIQPQFVTLAMCKNAVTQGGQTLQYVPLEFRTVKICMIAVKSNPSAVNYIPDLTYGLCKLAIKSNPNVILYIPRDKFTEQEYHELSVLVATRCGDMARCYQDWPHDAYLAAVKQNSWAIRHIQLEKLTLEMCAIAGRKNNAAYTFYCQNPTICLRPWSGSRHTTLALENGLLACRLNLSAFQFVGDGDYARFGVLRSLVADRLVSLCPLRLSAALLVEVSISLGGVIAGKRAHATDMDYGRWWPMCVAIKRGT